METTPEMFQIELAPTLTHCIETTAKEEYWKSVNEYLRIGEENEELAGKIELLRLFLESADFRELRRQSEPHLIDGKVVSFILYLEEGKPKYEMRVISQPL
jgi:hypothetical protein